MELRIKIPMVIKTLDPKGTRIISQVEKNQNGRNNGRNGGVSNDLASFLEVMRLFQPQPQNQPPKKKKKKPQQKTQPSPLESLLNLMAGMRRN